MGHGPSALQEGVGSLARSGSDAEAHRRRQQRQALLGVFRLEGSRGEPRSGRCVVRLSSHLCGCAGTDRNQLDDETFAGVEWLEGCEQISADGLRPFGGKRAAVARQRELTGSRQARRGQRVYRDLGEPRAGQLRADTRQQTVAGRCRRQDIVGDTFSARHHFEGQGREWQQRPARWVGRRR